MFKVSSTNLETLSLGHHGIVAGICKELKIAERIDASLSVHNECVVTPWQAVVSTIYGSKWSK